MKKIAFFACFVSTVFAGLPAWGEFNLQQYRFSLQAEAGVSYGTSREIVYQDPGSNDYLSELRWEIKPLFYAGLSLELAQAKPMTRWGFFASLGIRAGIPARTGTMEDRDWIPYVTPPGSLTRFSSHDNHTKAAISAELETGYSLPLWKILLKLYLGLDYRYFKWEARDGYTQYGPNVYEPSEQYPDVPWNSSFERCYKNAEGLNVTYSQHWFLLLNGIGADFFAGPLAFSAAVFAGPSFCLSVDDHHKRDLRITDILPIGLFVKPRGTVFLSLNDRWRIGLLVSWLYTSETRGYSSYDFFYDKEKSGIYAGSGAQLSVVDCALLVRRSF